MFLKSSLCVNPTQKTPLAIPISHSAAHVVISAGPGLLANADAGRWPLGEIGGCRRCQKAGRNKIENECDWPDKPANDTERQVDNRRSKGGAGERQECVLIRVNKEKGQKKKGKNKATRRHSTSDQTRMQIDAAIKLLSH